MKKKLSIALSLVLCAVLFFALGTVALATEAEPTEPVLTGEFTIYSSIHYWGEEVDTIEVELDTTLAASTVSVEDFEVRSESLDWRGRPQVIEYEVESVDIEGNVLTIEIALSGTGVNKGAVEAYKVDLVGEVRGGGITYAQSDLKCVAQVNPLVDQFAEGKTEKVQYRLYSPDTEAAAPLYIWLHGAGEFGTDNRMQLTCSNLANWITPEIQDIFGEGLYVAAIQTPSGGHKAADIMEAILQICDENNVDMSRIYLAGCSMGGAGVHTVISAYPDFFAAAIPNCPASTLTDAAAATLVDLPMMYVHAITDGSVNITNSINSYNRLVAAGSDNVWCAFFEDTGKHDITGNANDTHWSWRYIHANFTCDEENYIIGERVYTRNNVEYPYESIDLADLGYANIASWLADQQKELKLTGDFDYYSTCYDYGEEVHTVVIDTNVALDPETVSVEDFEVYFEALSCGSLRKTTRTVESVVVDGKTITLNLVMRGSGTNAPIGDTFYVNLIGEVADNSGVAYTTAEFACGEQINEDLDKMLEFATEDVQYRLYAPETEEAAPLYIWLHGAGEFGTDNRSQVSCSSLVNWLDPSVQDIFGGSLYVMAIQSPSSPHDAKELKAAIDEVCDNYNIDMSRIYLAGCSMGGMGVHTMITAYPDLFAAAIPNCPASTITAEQAELLVDLPILYVHAADDTTVRLTNSINSYNNIVAAGSDNIWCAFFENSGRNPVTGALNQGHWSWVWIHKNFTSNEAEFIKGAGEYNGLAYYSTPLSEIGEGYGSVAAWLADQSREPVVYGDFNFYSTCYDYGEEAHTVIIDTGIALDPETVSAEDFEVYFEAVSCGSLRKTTRTVESVVVDGSTVTLNLKMTGSGTNAPIGTNFYVNLVGEVANVQGNVIASSNFTCLGQINEQLDKMLEFVTEDVQYRLYAPEAEGEAPLYIWLHGAGEFGTDNRSQVSCSSLVNWLEPEVQDIFGGDLYVMAIQSPTSPHVAAKVMDAIMDVCTNYDIDMSRIYLAGCSMGGQGVHTMITAYPDFFAAAIPNCPASTISAAQAELLVDLPILYVHAADDTTVRLTNSINSYNNIVAAGSDNVWCAFFENSGRNPVTGALNQGHWSWTWIHKNFTSNEDEFISGEGIYINGNNEYPYVSTPLSEIGEGYANVASWLADQKNENVIYVDNFTAEQGDVVEIPVYIDNAANIATFRVQINNDIIEVDEIVMGDMLDVEGVNFTYNEANGMISWAAAEDISGDGVLFTIVATIVDPTANGEYVYNVEVIDIFDGEYNAADYTVVDGFITIDNPIVAGDVTMDGEISNADVIILARYLVELERLSADQLFYADFNGDGIINNSDLVQIVRYIVNA